MIAVSFRVLGPLEVEVAGRVVEALGAYAQVDRIPHDELGAEPGTPLREIHARLTGRPAPVNAAPPSSAPPSSAPPSTASPNSPFPVCQLPLDLPDFTGRERLVAELLGELHDALRRPRWSRAYYDRAPPL